MKLTELQSFLKDKKLYTGEVNGQHDALTKEAVDTLLKINPTVCPDYLNYSEQRRLVAAEQMAYRSLGLLTGAVDGISGSATEAARKAWNAKYGTAAPATVSAQAKTSDFPTPPKQSDMATYYGAIGTGHTRIVCPYPLFASWDTKSPISSFIIHEKAAPSALAALTKIKEVYTPEQIAAYGFNLFGGCYNDRDMRGGTNKSTHAYAAAIDFDPLRNQLKWTKDKAFFGKTRECDKFFEIWESFGWTSLGRQRGFDWMHVQHPKLG